MKPVFRFAPSPNGRLHLGHAYSALLNQRMARAAGGRLLLRIEDIDVVRCTPEYEEAIYRDLAWLGVEWETPVRRQSEHFDAYRDLFDRLVGEGLAYPAFMSRGEVRAAIVEAEARGERWPRDPDGAPLYPGLDKRLGARERRRRIDRGDPFAWRLDMAAAMSRLKGPLAWTETANEETRATTAVEARPQDWGDVIVARREIPTSYHLSVVAAAPAGDLRLRRAGLFPPPAGDRPGRAQAVEEPGRHRHRGTARARRFAGRGSRDGRTGVVVRGATGRPWRDPATPSPRRRRRVRRRRQCPACRSGCRARLRRALRHRSRRS